MSEAIKRGAAGCGQCGKPAVAAVNNVALCVDCYHRFEVARTLGFRIAAIGMNHAAAEMDTIAPFGPSTPRIQVPDIPKGPIILNNIKVDNSTVGSINTGNVASIDVNITYLKEGGNEKISEALKQLTEAIVNDGRLSTQDKEPLLDQIAFLSEQAAAAAKDRRPGMIKAAFVALNSAAPTISAFASVWTAIAPLLQSHFGN
ncbi:hypothetical protein [Paraburkholderia xenovorans]|uniref:hypothetical protein n=1 Tax=Paraburkholderia xenovorans TaxID=36873 RepID=UPI0015C531A1|nr:hypothetical protein [Paraburkholderia xenovorans]NPT36324.1 hypothetical protein [Paraburkholderia xenovorans]